MKITFFFQELFVLFVILQNFKGLVEKMMTSSTNNNISKYLVIMFESPYVALLDCQVALLWRMLNRDKSLKVLYFIVLIKIGLSRFIKRLSLRSNLNLLDSAAKISKLSKFIVQLHCNRWLDIADCLTFFRRFLVRFEIPMLI